MGYYTNRKLTLYDINLNLLNKEESTDIKEHLCLINNSAKYSFEYNEPDKWDECIDDIRLFSTLYPNIIFEIDCQGEDFDDAYKVYILNNKYVRCDSERIYEPLDINSLK